jgi:hypothetical protein
MGSCTSATKKHHQKLIKSSTLTNNLQYSTTKNSNSFNQPRCNTFSKPVQLIITKIPEEPNSEREITLSMDQNKTLNDLFNELKINPKSEYDIQIKDGQLIQDVDKSERIIDIFYQNITNINNTNKEVNFELIYKGLKIPENVIESYINKNPIIGSPVFDNPDFFAIITFNTKNKELEFYNYEHTDFSLLNKFNSFTAYCNANGLLYISGGENEQSEDFEKSVVEYNDFFYIDLKELKPYNNSGHSNGNDENIIKENHQLDIKELPNLLEPRTWHSMIFVPVKYIFIVGGSTKSVEVYDIEENTLVKDSDLLEMRSECTLCMVNDVYLYAFCGFLLHQTFNYTVERCNLRKSKRIWEFVQFNNNNNLKFIPSFFCVSYYKNNDIILVGGNDSIEECNKSYIVKIGMEDNSHDEINEFNFGEEKFGVFRDKLFTPIDVKYAINIPLIYGEHIQLLLLNMETGEIEQKFYDDIFNEE